MNLKPAFHRCAHNLTNPYAMAAYQDFLVAVCISELGFSALSILVGPAGLTKIDMVIYFTCVSACYVGSRRATQEFIESTPFMVKNFLTDLWTVKHEKTGQVLLQERPKKAYIQKNEHKDACP